MQSTPYIVSIDPSKSPVAAAVYDYGKEQYSTGFWHGVAYTSLAAIFLFSFKKLIISGIH